MVRGSGISAIVAIKRLSHAKQRLSPVLLPHERVRLARTMLLDVLTAVRTSAAFTRITVVSADPSIAAIAAAHDARLVADEENGLNAAVRAALQATAEVRHRSVLILPADVPFATASELQAIVGALDRHHIAIAPAGRDGGTNALALRHPGLIEPQFGEHSFARHCAAANAGGLSCEIVHARGLGHDIDCPSDLVVDVEDAAGTRTFALLAEFGIAARVQAHSLSERLR
jgi:2-phospho-L-lactate/phosphoenolpyruvate guanylyltransferase